MLPQSSRVALSKRTIIDDLSSATRECKINIEEEGLVNVEVKRLRDERLLKVLGLWEEMGETAVALRILREKGRKV